jgi:hypothetical protein
LGGLWLGGLWLGGLWLGGLWLGGLWLGGLWLGDRWFGGTAGLPGVLTGRHGARAAAACVAPSRAGASAVGRRARG